MEGQALVVRLDDRFEVRVEIETRELKRLQRPEQTADEEGDRGDEEVVADELSLGHREFSPSPLGRYLHVL